MSENILTLRQSLNTAQLIYQEISEELKKMVSKLMTCLVRLQFITSLPPCHRLDSLHCQELDSTQSSLPDSLADYLPAPHSAVFIILALAGILGVLSCATYSCCLCCGWSDWNPMWSSARRNADAGELQ